MRARGWCIAAVRLLTLLCVTVGTGLGVEQLSGPALRRAVDAGVAGTSPAALPLDLLVASSCAAALAACWLWLVLCGWLVAARTLTGSRRPARVPGCPRLVGSLVLAVLGVTALGLPASAADTGAGPGVTGLPLPDRVLASEKSVRVRPGDSLWRIAARLCPEHAHDGAIDRAWRALAAANRDRLGPDPDLIFPGTLLRLPGPDGALRKDCS